MSSATPAAPVFSYAQAAQGLSRSSQSSTKPPAPSSLTPEATKKNAKTTATEPAQLDFDAPSISSKAHKENGVSLPKSEAGDIRGPKAEAGNQEHSSQAGTNIASAEEPSSTTAAHALRQDDGRSTKDQVEESVSSPHIDSSEAWEHQSQISTKSNQSKAKAKSKDLDEDWEKISPQGVSVEKELKPAPVPTVNFWQQRRAENEARAKELAYQRTTTSSTENKHKTVQSANEQMSRRSLNRATNGTENEPKGGRRREVDILKSADAGKSILACQYDHRLIIQDVEINPSRVLVGHPRSRKTQLRQPRLLLLVMLTSGQHQIRSWMTDENRLRRKVLTN